MADSDNFVVHRQQGNPAALFFIHGFTGTAQGTWGDFPNLVAGDADLDGFDVFSWGYPSQFNLFYTVTKHFWTDDPTIHTIGQGLRSLLANFAQGYKKLILVGHSMGGLVIQSFILEELLRESHEHLRRLTEVILYGTPSGGLAKAALGSFLKNQIADMSCYGTFIQDLRSEWKRLVDDRRAYAVDDLCFRLTLVAGMKDTFVPMESSQNVFPLDEKEIVAGDHTSMVKPTSITDLAYCVLKRRLLRGAPTAEETAFILGKDQGVIDRINRITAAVELGDVEELNEIAEQALLPGAPAIPLADRALGLALNDHEQFATGAALLKRYLDFEMPVEKQRPFRGDVQVVQQLAVALSSAGDIAGALTVLNTLEPQFQNQSETLGIKAGRMKRQWLKNPRLLAVGQRALNHYQTAYQSAKQAQDVDQQIYNGINYAYMSFVLNSDGYRQTAEEILQLCSGVAAPDYWTAATQAEAHLLLGQYTEAAAAYRKAFSKGPVPRHLSTTVQQALDIMTRQGDPMGAQPVRGVIGEYSPLTAEKTVAG